MKNINVFVASSNAVFKETLKTHFSLMNITPFYCKNLDHAFVNILSLRKKEQLNVIITLLDHNSGIGEIEIAEVINSNNNYVKVIAIREHDYSNIKELSINAYNRIKSYDKMENIKTAMQLSLTELRWSKYLKNAV